jgi:CelD/BcsL family acetyltransferase involved in cellulose biosynthesis
MYHSMIQTYQQRFAAHAPGRVLLWEIFNEPGSEVAIFDFMPPALPHKTEWTADAVVVTDYAIVSTALGAVYLAAARRLKPAGKALLARLPPWLVKWYAAG